MIVKLTEQNFETEFDKVVLPMVIDVYADWCGPCNAMAPVIESIAEEYAGQLVVAKVNVDTEHEIASNFNVMSLPTLIFFDRNKKLVKQTVGFRSKEDIMANVYEILKS